MPGEDLLLDARYEKVREGGVVRDAAVLSVIGIGPVRCSVASALRGRSAGAPSWRPWLPVACAVAYIVSETLPGAARKALGGAVWQRVSTIWGSKRHPSPPNLAIRLAIGKELRRVWNAADRGRAGPPLVAAYRLERSPRASPSSRPSSHFQKRIEPRTSWSDPSSRRSSAASEVGGLARTSGPAMPVEIWETTEKPYITWKATVNGALGCSTFLVESST